MNRYEVIKKIRTMASDDVIVSNIGDVSKELFAAGDRDENFYMLGSMGLASSLGLGISLASKRNVIVLDGDGSIAMNLGSLVTIASQAPPNFKLVILDNASYGSTGYQATAISKVARLDEIVKAAGHKKVYPVSTIDEFKETMKKVLSSPECSIVIAKVAREDEAFPIITMNAETIKDRFMKSISDSSERSK